MVFPHILIIFLNSVLVGHSQICEPEGNSQEDTLFLITFILDGYDTTTDGTHIFVCYYDSQVC